MLNAKGSSATMNVECPCGHTFAVEVEKRSKIVKGLAVQEFVRRGFPCPICGVENLPSFELTRAFSSLQNQGLAEPEPLPHPNCKFHRRIEGEACSCAAWWEQEKIDSDRIEAMFCSACGLAGCEGGAACPENNIDLVRAERDSSRSVLRRMKAERYAARKLLIEALDLSPDLARRGKPKLEDLSCGIVAIMQALRLQSFVLMAEMGIAEGRPSEGWEVVEGEWTKAGPKGSKFVVCRKGMNKWAWSLQGISEGELPSGEHGTARGCMIQADEALADLIQET